MFWVWLRLCWLTCNCTSSTWATQRYTTCQSTTSRASRHPYVLLPLCTVFKTLQYTSVCFSNITRRMRSSAVAERPPMLRVIEHFDKSLKITQGHLKWHPWVERDCVSPYQYFTVTISLSRIIWDTRSRAPDAVDLNSYRPVAYILESCNLHHICLCLEPLKSYKASKLTMLKNTQKRNTFGFMGCPWELPTCAINISKGPVELMLSPNWRVTLRLTVFEIFAVEWLFRGPKTDPFLFSSRIWKPLKTIHRHQRPVRMTDQPSCKISRRSVARSSRCLSPDTQIHSHLKLNTIRCM